MYKLPQIHFIDALWITFNGPINATQRVCYKDHESKNFTACLNESVGIHVNIDERETSKFSDEILRRIESLAEVHSKIPRPKQIIRQMGLR